MQIEAWKQCPVCGGKLKREVYVDKQDYICVECSVCGKFAMSMEFYEDYFDTGIVKEKMALFLDLHKKDALAPFLTIQPCNVPDGYRCYPARSIFWSNSGK